MSVKSAGAILDELTHDGIAVEVTGRCARRLFGLRGFALRATVAAPPRRPETGRGCGRPRLSPAEAATPAPAAPLGPAERQAFGDGDLEVALAAVEEAVRRARQTLGRASAADTAGEAPPSPP